MPRAEFESRLAELEARIAECPADQQEALRTLADETRERQSMIDENISRARAGVATLRLTEELAAMNMSMIADAAGRLRSLGD